MIANESKSVKASLVFFLAGMLWMVLAFGTVVLSSNSWKFAPAFFLFTISIVIRLFFHSLYLRFYRESSGKILLLFALSTLLIIIPGSIRGENYDFLYNSAQRISYFGIALTAFLVIDKDSIRKKILYMSALLLLSQVIVGILEITEVINLTMYDSYKTTGTFNNPNLFAGVLIVLIPLLFPFLILFEPGKKRISLMILLLSSFLVLFFTYCRSAYIGFICSLIIGSLIYTNHFVNDRELRKKIILFSMILMVLIIGIALTLPAVRIKLSRTLLSGEPRLLSFSAAIKMWLNSPKTFFIGNGIGSFRRLLPQYSYAWYIKVDTITSWHAVHNEYLELLLEAGICGFVPSLIFLITLYKFYLKNVKNKVLESFTRLYSLGIIMSASAFLVDSFFSTNFREAPIAGLFYIIVFSGLNTGSEQNEIPINKIKRIFLIFVFIVVFCFPLSRNIIRLYTDRVLLVAQESEDRLRKVHLLELAASIEPQNALPELMLSRELLKQGNYSSFKIAADKVEALIPSFADIHYLRGHVFTAEGDHKKAVSEYKKHLNGGDYDIKGERALLFSYLWLEDYEQALISFQSILRKDLEHSYKKDYEILFSDAIDHIKIENNGKTSITIGEDYIIQTLRFVAQKSQQSANLQFIEFHKLILELYKAGNIEEAQELHKKEIDYQFNITQSVP